MRGRKKKRWSDNKCDVFDFCSIPLPPLFCSFKVSHRGQQRRSSKLTVICCGREKNTEGTASRPPITSEVSVSVTDSSSLPVFCFLCCLSFPLRAVVVCSSLSHVAPVPLTASFDVCSSYCLSILYQSAEYLTDICSHAENHLFTSITCSQPQLKQSTSPTGTSLICT